MKKWFQELRYKTKKHNDKYLPFKLHPKLPIEQCDIMWSNISITSFTKPKMTNIFLSAENFKKWVYFFSKLLT